MAKVLMTCRKICCGKTTYAKKLQADTSAVILSLDEVMFTMYPEGAGGKHDELVIRAEQYLLNLSLQIIATGTNVIFDCGLWTRAQRERIRNFYEASHVENEIHYLNISDEEWKRRIESRNRENPSGTYYVDEGLLSKAKRLFQEPIEGEIDLVVAT